MANPNTARFPGALPTDTDLLVASNGVQQTLIAPMGLSDASMILDAVTFNTPCVLRIDNEFIRVDGATGSTCSPLVRGFGGSTPSVHSAGATVSMFIPAWAHNQLAAEVKAICLKLGPNLSNVLTPHVVGFSPATNQNGTGILKMSCGATHIPSIVVLNGTTGEAVLAVAQFNTGDYLQDHFPIPPDWTGAIDVQIVWRTAATSGNVGWNLQTWFVGSGSSFDIAPNPTDVITQAASTIANKFSIATLSNINVTGGAVNSEMFFQISRSASDTITSPPQLLSIRFLLHRT